MFDGFTERANHSVMLAEEEARKLHRSYVGTGMLLLGVIAEGGTTSRILDEFGVTLDTARAEIQALMGPGAGAGHVEVPLSENAKLALEFARAESEKRSLKDVAVPHILLGLLNGKDSVATRVFDVMGVNFNAVTQRVTEELDRVYGPRA